MGIHPVTSIDVQAEMKMLQSFFKGTFLIWQSLSVRKKIIVKEPFQSGIFSRTMTLLVQALTHSTYSTLVTKTRTQGIQ